MKTSPITPRDIARSVWAVPPLSLTSDAEIRGEENQRLVRHIEAGGVTTILYGGNANIYAATADLFADLIERLPSWVGEETWAIPSVGPDWGKLMDQARMLGGTAFPAALLLPMAGPNSPAGVERAIRDFVDRSGIPAIVYLRAAGYLPPNGIAALIADGTVVAVKYAVETGDLTRDAYLDAILVEAPRERIVSGIGELAAISHLDTFRLACFTAGAVCIAPRRAMAILAALKRGDVAVAKQLAEPIRPLENLRIAHGPIPVIHDAVSEAAISDMGDLMPHLSRVLNARSEIREAAVQLLVAESEFTSATAQETHHASDVGRR